MDQSTIIEKIVLFGLSRQEAIIYLCLLKNGELTGYEVAKQTSISRSNVYSSLAGSVDRGAAYLIEGSANKYIAVNIEEFCNNQIRHLEEIKILLCNNIEKENNSSDGYITIEGYQHIYDKIHHMIRSANQRVYFSAPMFMIARWKEEIVECVNRGIQVTLITDYVISDLQEKQIIVYIKEDERSERIAPIRLIIDSEYVLTGNITEAHNDTCLYSAQKDFVNVFKEAMSNEIKLIEISKE